MEEEKGLLNKCNEMMKQILEKNIQKAKIKCFNCGKVISKGTAKRHARDQDPSRQQGIINERAINYVHKRPR